MKKNIYAFAKKMLAFSLIELTVTLVVIAIMTAAFAPIITKRMKATSTAIVGLSTQCTKRVNANCQLCDKTGCVWCGLSRSTPNKYVNEKTCTHENCIANCLRCSEAGANCLQCSPGYYLSSGSCLDCPAGKYCLGGAKAPVNCPAGTYQATAGAHTSCTNCSAGTYQGSAGQTGCINCIAGTYQSSIGQSSCASCPAGSYSSSVASTSCTLCSAGTYQGSTGQTSCTSCSAGTYQDAKGQSSCITCPINNSCAAGSTAPTACGIGQGANGGNSACASCPTGCYDCQNTAKCEYCQAKYFLNSSGLCETCPANHYCPANTKHAAYACPGATYSAAGSESCSSCASFDPFCVQCNTTKCLACATGYTLSGNTCLLPNCEPGEYRNDSGSCTTCSAGYYCPEGATSQTICPANKWSAAGAASCTACTSGVSPAGSTSADSCKTCTQKYGTGCATCNSSACLTCSSGYYLGSSPSSSSACASCRGTTHHANCITCTSSACSTCDTGYYPSSKTCTSCRTKWHANCSGCNSSTCLSCDDGYTTEGTGCNLIGCAAGKFKNASNICEDCPAGHYCTGGQNEKAKCDSVHFQPNTGQSSCFPCPYSNTAVKGATNSVDDRQYYMWWFNATSDRTSCQVNCAPGLYYRTGSLSTSFTFNSTYGNYKFSGKDHCHVCGREGYYCCSGGRNDAWCKSDGSKGGRVVYGSSGSGNNCLVYGSKCVACTISGEARWCCRSGQGASKYVSASAWY